MSTWLVFLDTLDDKNQISVKKVGNLIKVPQVYQPNGYSCGLAALQSVLAYYGKEFRFDELEEDIKPDPEVGAEENRMVKFARAYGLKADFHDDVSIKALWTLLDEGIPVIVTIQAWPKKKKNLEKSWDEGHYIVAIGYDNENVYFMDSSVLGHYTFIPIKEFENRWRNLENDKKLIHPAIVITSKNSKIYDPDIIKRTK